MGSFNHWGPAFQQQENLVRGGPLEPLVHQVAKAAFDLRGLGASFAALLHARGEVAGWLEPRGSSLKLGQLSEGRLTNQPNLKETV